ncbi:MAG: DUF1501 domain-containing protein [Gemmatales bacterium]|nr:DUF1501 domain-containing protein [Gemmatales bacterium]MDW8388105.1 DUF1501 domain-containing protein [Gemmatales bacterium]
MEPNFKSVSPRLVDIYRRDFLKLSAAGVVGTCFSGWLNILAADAAKAGIKHKSCIVLWMEGGPSHKDTFDMKPGTADAGEFSEIPTSVPGIRISEHFPKFAQLMQHAAILRGMSTGEGAHARARYYLHTGYREGQGGLVYPSIGSIAAMELGDPEFPLPNYVCIGGRSFGSGFLGPRHQPLVVTNPDRGVENLKAAVDEQKFSTRFSLLEEMEKGFHKEYQATNALAHQTTYQRAVQLMQSREAKAFDISQEPAAVRAAYGETQFGRGCLLARRLVEVGVAFVEVTLGGWDTHQDNFDRVKRLSAVVDPAMSALVTDLKDRGLLDSTLIVWMGDFGRTPKINNRGPKPGRDHYPRAWSTVLIGGGIKGGQVIGRTDKEGAVVEERMVTTLDFMATICQILGIDYTKRNIAPGGRPIRIVDKGANPVTELFA